MNTDKDRINLFDPVDHRYYGFSFGGGALWDEVSEGCDDYVYCSIGNELGGDDDGGQLDFCRENSGYNGDIWKAIPDALKFLDLPDAVIQRLHFVG